LNFSAKDIIEYLEEICSKSSKNCRGSFL